MEQLINVSTQSMASLLPFRARIRHSYKVAHLQPMSYKRVSHLLPVRYPNTKSVRLETAICGDSWQKTAADIFRLMCFKLVPATGTYFDSIIVSLFNL